MKKELSKHSNSILHSIAINIQDQNELFEWDKYIDSFNKPIHYLAYHKQNKIIKQINLSIFKDQLWELNGEGDTIVHIASKTNNIDLFNYAINTNIDIIYIKNKLGMTPLFYFLHNHKIIKQIVCTHAIIDHFVCCNYTLLDYYIQKNNVPMILYLADTLMFNENSMILFTILDSQMDTPTKIKLLKNLISHGININLLNNKFLSLLIISVTKKQYNITKFLLKNGADINYYGPENLENPLTIAFHNNDIKMIKLLLKNRININIQDKHLCTPLHYLFSIKNEIPINIKRYLLNNICNINICDKFMNSVLNLLTQNEDWTKYEDILENKKLDVNLKNKNGISTLNNIPSTQIDKFFDMIFRSYVKQLDPNVEWADKKDNEMAIAVNRRNNIEKYKKYVNDKILSGFSYPKKKKRTKIFFPIPPITNVTHFSSVTYSYICYLGYLLNKYSNIKIPSLAIEQKNNDTKKIIKKYSDDPDVNKIFKSILRDYANHSPILTNHIIIWKNPETFFISPHLIDGINNTAQKFPDVKFILIKLTIITNANFNHANMIIYDIPNNYMERFDPYGKVPYYDNDIIDHTLESFFKKNIPNINYISSHKLINNISYQVISDENNINNHYVDDPAGFCVAWCIWYIELRINNPDINIKSLTNKSIRYINKKETKVKDYIRNYSNYLDKKKNKILKRGGVNKKFWYAFNMPFDIHKRYIKYINNFYKIITGTENDSK